MPPTGLPLESTFTFATGGGVGVSAVAVPCPCPPCAVVPVGCDPALSVLFLSSGLRTMKPTTAMTTTAASSAMRVAGLIRLPPSLACGFRLLRLRSGAAQRGTARGVWDGGAEARSRVRRGEPAAERRERRGRPPRARRQRQIGGAAQQQADDEADRGGERDGDPAAVAHHPRDASRVMAVERALDE